MFSAAALIHDLIYTPVQFYDLQGYRARGVKTPLPTFYTPTSDTIARSTPIFKPYLHFDIN